MNRRHFLRYSGALPLAALLSSPLVGCSKENPLDNLGYGGKVLIIGAGTAGLYAGFELKKRGIDFQILEASSVYGGRLAKLAGFANFPIDLGAQWLHGKKSILGDLAERSGTKFTLDDSDGKFWFKNQLITKLPRSIAIFEGRNLPDISYLNHASQQGFGPEYRYIVENIAGDQGAAASRLSVYYNNLEEENWSSGDEDYKFRETFYDLIDQQIATPIKDRIVLNTAVRSIDYTQSKITVTASNQQTYTADKVIITVPITILKSGDIQFTPPLPASKTTAFSKIGMDAGMKVFLKFKNKFYDQNIMGGTYCAAYADDSVGKSPTDNVLLAFVMGEQAEYLSSLSSDSARVTVLLKELDLMYKGQATTSFLDAIVQDWTTHPFIRGAYSYSTVGMGDARKTAAQPIDNKLFFAGEAMNLNGHHQTVHGAAESGLREVENILRALNK